MSRRLDVELTSERSDGTWTWRAAGAKQPRGLVEASLLREGVKVGDVLRVEAEIELDGITITAVLPQRDARSEPARLELVGPPPPTELVTTDVSRTPKRGRGLFGDDREQRAPGRTQAREKPPASRAAHSREDRPPRSEPRTRERAPRRVEAAPVEPTSKPKRLNAGTAHREAVLESLSPEHRAVAEQVLRGGIPAVRSAVEAQNAASPPGAPEIKPEPLVGLAEELLPRLKAADWRDKAEAAVAVADEISVRDLRALVAGADVAARDDAGRLLASTLRQALERRVGEQRSAWLADVTRSLDEGRVIRSLRLASRAPDPSARVPAELAVRLSDAASGAMSPDVACDRWLTLLDAVAGSPVRRTVKPVGLPDPASEELLIAARNAAGRVPALAAMLGFAMPPPPTPLRRLPPKPPRPLTKPPTAIAAEDDKDTASA